MMRQCGHETDMGHNFMYNKQKLLNINWVYERMMKKEILLIIAAFGLVILLCKAALAQEEALQIEDPGGEDLAKKLANPVASLISVPIQANYDDNFGASDNGSTWRINVQPVIPVSISKNWNLISRTILPVITQDNIPVNGAGASGIGDTLQSFFFSPKKPTSNGIIWGIGPAVLLNTASKDALGSKKWGAGPTGVALRQKGPWTYGMLANHIESFAGDNNRPGVSATFMQPFLAYITHSKTTFTINSESTYDWKTENWAVPINFIVSQLFTVGNQTIQVGGGLRYWADSPDLGPEGLGARLNLTFLFPK
jgi:hypothetical protein